MIEDGQESRKTARELLDFIGKSPSCFHAVAQMSEMLKQAGFELLQEAQEWKLKRGGNYYVTRNQSSLIAFRIPRGEYRGFQMMASHSDSPTFKIKENPEMPVENWYRKLNVEKYGGMICSSWFDRPLSVAGRLLIREEGKMVTRLVNVDRDLVLIPNLAIHMNRKINEGYEYNVQKDLLPLFGCHMGEEDRAQSGKNMEPGSTDQASQGQLLQLLADQASIKPEQILGSDLFLYNRMPGTVWGAEEEFISSPRLDDLQCAFASLKGLLQTKEAANVAVHCVFDNEEVGSGTKQGAASGFLKDTLERIQAAFHPGEPMSKVLASSFMVSADNAHAVHPNDMEKTDPTNRPYLNGGIVMKGNANQKYTTDAVSAALFQIVCEQAGVEHQSFVNRSDMAGGSTLGNISNTQVALNTVDIGLPQLAMHSAYETAGVLDTESMVRFARALFEAEITSDEDGAFCIK